MSCCCAERARAAMRTLNYTLRGDAWYDPRGRLVMTDAEVETRHKELLPVAVKAVRQKAKNLSAKMYARLFG